MAVVTAGVGAGEGLAKFFEGRAMQKKAQEFIDNFEWKDLYNAYDNQQISTKSADLQKEQALVMGATAVSALQGGGVRGLVGGLGRVQASENDMNRKIGADLDKQQKMLDYKKSAQDMAIQNMEEKRQADELAGYGQMLYAGMNLKMQGMGDIASAGTAFGQSSLGEGIDNKVLKGLFG